MRNECQISLFMDSPRYSLISTVAVNPPYAMRFMSNGIDLELHIPVMRESFIILALTRFRCPRDCSSSGQLRQSHRHTA